MAFSVTIKKSGHTFECAEDSSILAAGLKAGYMLPYNCRSGLCHTCKAKVVKGDVRYTDKPLENYLSSKDVAAGAALLCQASPASDLVIDAREILDLSVVEPIITPCRITGIVRLADDVIRLTLRLPMNEHLRYMAGQHLSILLDDGVRRDYSIASPCPASGVTELELHVRHVPGGIFTDRLFSDMKPRALLKIELPLGSFFVRNSNAPIIMMATGTGFAPIKAMIEQLDNDEVRHRPIDFYWGGRTLPDLYDLSVAETWAAEKDYIRFIPVLSRPTANCAWSGRIGHVQHHVLADHPDLSQHEIYACGSPTMIHDARALLVTKAGANPDAFYSDEFLTAADRPGLIEAGVSDERY